MSDERWRPIPGFAGYEVSDRGNVRSFHPYPRNPEVPRLLAIRTNTYGYPSVMMKHRKHAIHQLVMQAFVGPASDGHEVRHLDGSRTNNHLSNLAYGTRSENQQDSVRHGTHRNLRKTECDRGHPYTPETMRIEPDGRRRCRVCATLLARINRAKRKAEAIQ
jgi:hypothetical protein